MTPRETLVALVEALKEKNRRVQADEHTAIIEEAWLDIAHRAHDALPALESLLAESGEPVERLRGLLKVAKCPNCDGSGRMMPDGDQCQWCYERTSCLKEEEKT